MTRIEGNPWKIGQDSIRANHVAMVALVVFALAVSVIYFLVPGVRVGFQPLHALMTRHGAFAAFASTVVFMGLVPAVFFWAGRDYSLGRVRADWPSSFVRGLRSTEV